MRTLVLLAVALGACSSSPSITRDTPVVPVAYTWVPMASGVEVPVPTLPDRPELASAIQADLEGRLDATGCDDADGYFEPTVTVPLAQDDVFSVEIHVSRSCGGPYPTNDDNRSATYDLRSGDSVPFQALFAGSPRDAQAIRAAYLDAVGTPSLADCSDVLTPETVEIYGLAFALAPDGIVLQPTFPHVIEACAERAVVPYTALWDLLAPAGVAVRVATGR